MKNDDDVEISFYMGFGKPRGGVSLPDDNIFWNVCYVDSKTNKVINKVVLKFRVNTYPEYYELRVTKDFIKKINTKGDLKKYFDPEYIKQAYSFFMSCGSHLDCEINYIPGEKFNANDEYFSIYLSRYNFKEYKDLIFYMRNKLDSHFIGLLHKHRSHRFIELNPKLSVIRGIPNIDYEEKQKEE